jgi:glutaminyl-peptide cyclotransferase
LLYRKPPDCTFAIQYLRAMNKLLTLLSGLVFLAACNNTGQDVNPNADAEPPRIGFSVVNTYPHDTSFFTEGLEFHEGQLYESSGSMVDIEQGRKPEYSSAFGIVDLKTGRVDKKAALDSNLYFGEGITFIKGKVYQLTYKDKKGFVYDAKTFKKLQEFSYPGQGWALTHDSSRIYMSDGSSNLKIIDPAAITSTLKPESILSVTDNNGPVSNINELEYVDGYIYANQWQTHYILKIDPRNGKVVGKLNLDNIVEEARKKDPELGDLNGIAYNTATKSFFVTGKNWPSIFEIKLN